MSDAVQRQTTGPRATGTLLAVAALVAIVASVSFANSVLWYNRPIPGVLVDPGGSVSNIGLPHWARRTANLEYPSRIAIAGQEHETAGSRTWTRHWDEAVANAASKPYLDVVVISDASHRRVRLPMHRLEPLAWWVYAGTSLFGGLLYAGAGLIALWARPQGPLARAFAKFAVAGGLFLFSLFEIHTERALTPVFFASWSFLSTSLIVLFLNFPEPFPWLRRFPWIERTAEGLGLVLASALLITHATDGDTRPLQSIAALLLGVGLFTFVVGSLFRYVHAKGEQKHTLRVLLATMVPPYAGTAAFLVLSSSGVLSTFPDYAFFPPLILAPLANLYAFVKHDLWGSRALLSRIGTNLFLGALACAVAIATGTALAAWTGAAFRDALAGAAGGGIAAAVLVVAALRLSDFALFRSRAEYKPTIDRLSEDLTALSSPSDVAHAIERTVRRWLPCDVIQLTLAPAPSRTAPTTGTRGDIHGQDVDVPESGASLREVEPPRAESADLRIPVAFGGRPLGWLDVGAKRRGALFTSDDIDLLRTIANHGGLALAHAEAYQELEQRRRQQAEAWRGEREALVETVAAEIAHEIRYPINYFRSLFERGARNLKLTEDDVDVGREEIDRLERLVSGLKRMAAHRIERTPTAVSELCTRVEALLRDSLERRRIELEIGKNATLRCDPDKMTQVLTNLLANALEACGPNGRIGIVWNVGAHGGELSVWDDGPGFVGDPSRLFAPWYTTKPRGTGLGLAITHRLVRAHGWSINAQRRDTRTFFTVTVRGEDIVRETEEANAKASEARVA